ncbi:MAG TPA: hypothetical protein VGZ47_13040 [Gemmataceae bacterium]|jgi:hypothetical protein|nr:hypothetical protein [Gemmataceae bacterium]
MKLLSNLLLAIVLGLGMATAAGACPLCSDGIPQAEDGTDGNYDPERLSRAYNYSIYTFIGMTYGMGTMMGIWVYRSYRKKSAEQDLNSDSTV